MLETLIKKQLQKIGRTGSMCWIGFGKLLKVKSFKDNIIEKNEYNLNLQCPWRIKDSNSKIILASADIYEPNSKIVWNKDFEWDKKGNNLFDENVEKIFFKKNTILVEEVLITVNNDLIIVFSNESTLECYTDTSSEQECWRFFKIGDDKHLVSYGNEIKIE